MYIIIIHVHSVKWNTCTLSHVRYL